MILTKLAGIVCLGAAGGMYRLTTDAMEKMFLKNREALDQEGEE